jgi:hypothetical protein
MKIFWSWQSDTDGKTGRHFVRKALNAAIKELKEAEDVEEPNEKARAEALHSDAGIEGIAGSPDVVNEIFKKIKFAAIILADITPVGEGPPRKDEHGKRLKRKKFMNPNVAIELGYGMKELEENHFLMVMNAHYGDRSSVPFDLAGRGGPIIYKLAPDRAKEEYDAEFAKLRGWLKQELREFLKTPAAPATPPAPFVPTAPTINPSAFWQPNEVLYSHKSDIAGLAGKPEEIYLYRFNSPTALYIRVMPLTSLTDELRDTVMNDAIAKRPRAMTRTVHGCSIGKNQYGAIAYEADNNGNIEGLVQTFRNGEVWCVSCDLTRKISRGLVMSVPTATKIMTDTLWKLLSLMKNYLHVMPPYRVVMGVTGFKGGSLGIGNNELSNEIHINDIEKDFIIDETDPNEDDALEAVEAFIDKLCDKGNVTYVKQKKTA